MRNGLIGHQPAFVKSGAFFGEAKKDENRQGETIGRWRQVKQGWDQADDAAVQVKHNGTASG